MGMEKKKIIVSMLCMALLLMTPVQAYAAVCTHPVLVKPNPVYVYHGFDTTFYQHQEWFQKIEYCCLSCDAEFFGDIEYADWENHDYVIDWEHPDVREGGLVYYDFYCSTCGYADDLNNNEIADLGL